MVQTWSVSRDQVLQTCERKYYFRYLTPARINSRDSILKEIALLRKLSNIPMWKGKLVHSVIAEFLEKERKGIRETVETLAAKQSERMNQQWEESHRNCQKGLAEQVAFIRNKGVLLSEHFYGQELRDDKLDTLIKDVAALLARFGEWTVRNNVSEIVRNASNVWIEPPTAGSKATHFEVNQTRIVLKVDLAVLNQQGQFMVFDWKTSEPYGQSSRITHNELQAYVYQLWPHLHLGRSLDAVSARFVYFGGQSPQEQVFTIDEDTKQYVLDLIGRSLSRMEYFDQVHHDNMQKTLDGLLRFTLRDLDYAYSVKACIGCQFKQICQRELGL